MDENLDIEVNPIFATTHMVRQTIMTVESLHNAAASVNDRDRKPTMTAEHDRLCPPMGQTVSCKVVPMKDGHHALVGEYDIFPPPEEIHLPDGEIGLKQQSKTNQFPFATAEFHHADAFCIGTDPTNLGGIDGIDDFFDQIRDGIDTEFETQPIERRSAIPDPELIITLGLQISAAWFGVRIAKAAADSIEPQLKELFDVLIKSVKRMAINAIPKHRPVTYVVQVIGKPNLEFVARTRDANAVISALVNDDMSNLKPQIDRLKKQYKAEMVQFKLDENGKWLFTFLLTKDGKVIGTKEAYNHRAVVLSNMEKNRKKRKTNA